MVYVPTLFLRQFTMHVYHFSSEQPCLRPNCECQELWIHEKMTESRFMVQRRKTR